MFLRRIDRRLFTGLTLLIGGAVAACGEASLTRPVAQAPMPRFSLLEQLERGQFAPGVQFAHARAREGSELPKSLFADLESHNASFETSSLDCDAETEVCMSSALSSLVSIPKTEITGLASMNFKPQNVSVYYGVSAWVVRFGYQLGLEQFPYVSSDVGTDFAAHAGDWNNTCNIGRYSSIEGSQRTVGIKVTGPDLVKWWGPRTLNVEDECNPDDELCDEGGNDQLRSSLQLSSRRASLSSCDGAGDMDQPMYECGLYQYEISYDGGVTWFPYGEPFVMCELINAQLQANKGLNGDPARAAVRSGRAVRVIGKGLLDDAAFAYATRSLRSASPVTVEVDTAHTSAENLEGAFIGLDALMRESVSESSATHLRLKVGRGSLSSDATARAAARAQSVLTNLKRSPEQLDSRGRRVRVLDVTVEEVPTQRRPTP